MRHIGIHAGGISLKQMLSLGRQMLIICLCDAIETEPAHEAIGLDRGRADYLRQSSGTQPARQVHLEQAILGMDEAEGECRVQLAAGADGDDPDIVAADVDGRGEYFPPCGEAWRASDCRFRQSSVAEARKSRVPGDRQASAWPRYLRECDVGRRRAPAPRRVLRDRRSRKA